MFPVLCQHSRNIYICSSVHILSLHYQRVHHGHVTLGGRRVDTAGPALVGHQEGDALLEEDHGGLRVTIEGGDMHESTPVLGSVKH